MSGFIPKYIEKYLKKLEPGRDDLLREMEDYAKAQKIPIASSTVCRLLYTFIIVQKPEKILEIGTAIGYSTIWMARALQQTISVGRQVTSDLLNLEYRPTIITIDWNKERVEKAKEYIERAGLYSLVEVVYGDALKILSTMETNFDLIFLDATKRDYLSYLNLCLPLLKKGGILFTDNILFRGMVAKRDREIDSKYIDSVKLLRTFVERIACHHLLETIILTVGDGIAISYKKEG